MNETQIDWTEWTWNPMSGCQAIAPECKYCYAETLAENKRGTAGFPNGFELTLRPHKLKEPGKLWRKHKRGGLIFVNSMSDPFLDEVPDDYRDQIFDVMREYDGHRYQVLTKRIDRAVEYFKTREVPASVWLGVTCGHISRVPTIDTLKQLRDRGARVLFVSCEPILSDLEDDFEQRLIGIDWVITGGESGNHLSNPFIARQRALVVKRSRSWVPREDRVDWIRGIDRACQAAGVAHWFKQWGGTRPKSAGNLLDGELVHNMPTVAGAMPAGDYQHRATHKRQAALPIVTAEAVEPPGGWPGCPACGSDLVFTENRPAFVYCGVCDHEWTE